MAEIRTFIAIPVDAGIIARLTELQGQLRQTGADVSWTRPAGIHLTLKFLGNVAEERLPAIGDALAAIGERTAPFRVTVVGTGAFPHLHRPRVVWAGIDEGAEPLRALAARVDEALARLGFPREQRPLSPHLTLGRVKSQAGVDRLRAVVEAQAHTPFGEMRAEVCHLLRSDLSPKGARYTVLRAAPFLA